MRLIHSLLALTCVISSCQTAAPERIIVEFPIHPETRDEFIVALNEILVDTRAYDGCGAVTVWTNEEDHVRIISMQMGDDIKEVFTRFAKGAAGVQEVVKKEGYDFMHNDHLGYILVCPSNLGTGLRASVMVPFKLIYVLIRINLI